MTPKVKKKISRRRKPKDAPIYTVPEMRTMTVRSLQDHLNDIKRRVDEFDNFLVEMTDELEPEKDALAELVCGNYRGVEVDMSDALTDFRDEVLAFEGRIKQTKIRSIPVYRG